MEESGGDGFERQTYEFARHWARMTRRDLLRYGGMAAAMAFAPGLRSIPAWAAAGAKGLRIARGQESDSLDPQKTSLLVSHEVMWQIYDSLIYLDEKGTVYPGLATSWALSDNNRIVTFKLREGVKFHDGTPFDAHVVKWTVDRMRDPKTASPTLFLLGPLDSVKVIDSHTVAYIYKSPYVALWVGLSYSYTAPISPAAVQKYGTQFGRNPVGTGPFKFVRWGADQTIALEKNLDHAWATPMYKNKGGAKLDRAEFVVIPEDATRLSALIAGEVDVVAGTDAVPIDKIKMLEQTQGIKVVKRPAVGVYYSYINTTVTPLNDVRVRRAINYAVDKQKLITLVLDGNGKPATSPVASAFADYDSNVTKYSYNLDKAKQLMKEAGQEQGFDLLYLVIDTPFVKRTAEVVQEDLAKINIRVKIQAFTVGDLIARGKKKEFGLAFFYYTYSDPDVVTQLIRSDQPFSWSFQQDKTLDTWLQAQQVEFNKAKRRRLLSDIQARHVDQALWLYLFESVYAAAMRDYVTGLDLDTVGFIHLQDIDRVS